MGNLTISSLLPRSKIKRAGWEGGMPKAWQLWFDVPPEPEQLIGDSGIPPLPIENYYSFTSAQVDSFYQIDDALRIDGQLAERTMMAGHHLQVLEPTNKKQDNIEV